MNATASEKVAVIFGRLLEKHPTASTGELLLKLKRELRKSSPRVVVTPAAQGTATPPAGTISHVTGRRESAELPAG